MFVCCWQERSPCRSAQLWSDIRIHCYVSLSPAHLSRFPSHSLGGPQPPQPIHLCPLSLPARLQLKGKCSSGEVCYLHRRVPGLTMWPGPPNISLSYFSSCLLFFFTTSDLFISVCSSRNRWSPESTSLPSSKVQLFAEKHYRQCKVSRWPDRACLNYATKGRKYHSYYDLLHNLSIKNSIVEV